MRATTVREWFPTKGQHHAVKALDSPGAPPTIGLYPASASRAAMAMRNSTVTSNAPTDQIASTMPSSTAVGMYGVTAPAGDGMKPAGISTVTRSAPTAQMASTMPSSTAVGMYGVTAPAGDGMKP